MRFTGKSAVITGASQGLGLRIAEQFAREGANVLICGRNTDALAMAQQTLERGAGARVRAMKADVSRPEDVRSLAGYAMSEFGGVDILVCNAGVYGPKGRIEDIDWDQWALAVQINLFGVVLCCREFIPYLAQSPRGKIIILSGGGATKPMPQLSAYAASKAAVVRFGETLAEELQDRHVDVNMVAPGALNTRLLEEILEAGPEKVGRAFYEASVKQKASGGTPLEKGAELCTYLASDESNGITGKLISAVWDPWKEFAAHRDDLAGTDIYTLRRIVPKERGKNWG